MKIIDISGKTFGLLEVVRLHKGSVFNGTYWSDTLWECRCECGETCYKYKRLIISGKTKSCGCLRIKKGRDKFEGVGELSKTHWSQIIRHANNKKHEVAITIEDAWNLFCGQNRKCAITGTDIHFVNSGAVDTTASLDRIDSGKGYIIGNVQWVHKDINSMKSNLKQEKFITLCKLVANNN